MQLLDLLDKIRVNWQKSDAESKMYKSQVITLEKQLKDAEKANSTLNDLLLNCQSQLTHLMNSKQEIECQLDDYKRCYGNISIKRKRSRNDAEITATINTDSSDISINGNGTVKIRQHPIRKRSMSENNIGDRRERVVPSPRPYATPHHVRSTFDLRSPSKNLISWTMGQEIDRRLHRATALFSIFESCDVCTKKFGIAAQSALRCVGMLFQHFFLTLGLL